MTSKHKNIIQGFGDGFWMEGAIKYWQEYNACTEHNSTTKNVDGWKW